MPWPPHGINETVGDCLLFLASCPVWTALFWHWFVQVLPTLRRWPPAMKMNKDMAMKHMDLATTSMKANKADECMGHMGEAMGAMHKKM